MCAECHFSNCPSGCPNYESPAHDYECSFCGHGMYYESRCVNKNWNFICPDCIENLSDDQLAYLLDVVWRSASDSDLTCHLCEGSIEKDEVYTSINGKSHHKECLEDLEQEHLLQLAGCEWLGVY